jgi:hypothetical protein
MPSRVGSRAGFRATDGCTISDGRYTQFSKRFKAVMVLSDYLVNVQFSRRFKAGRTDVAAAMIKRIESIIEAPAS